MPQCPLISTQYPAINSDHFFDYYMVNKLIVATDGSANVSLGIGGCGVIIDGVAYHAKTPRVVFTSRPILSVTQVDGYRLINVDVSGDFIRATNNRAELFAIYLAVAMTRQEIRILTDSKYCIHAFCGGFIAGLNDEDILSKINGDLLLLIKNAIIDHPGVSFKKIKAHVSKRDMAKLTGVAKQYALLNELADKYSKYNL